MTIKNIFFRGHNCLNVSFTNTSKNEAFGEVVTLDI